MLKLDLIALEKAGSLAIEASIPEDGSLWAESGLKPASPWLLQVKASVAASREIVVRGSLKGRVSQDCRRCLEPISVPVESDVVLVFATPDPLVEEADVRPVSAEETELDLEGPLREELMLSVVPYAVCSATCKGLCAGCGANLNEETCRCTSEAVDPRWDALRTLKTD